MMRTIWTIGHSNHTIGKFISLLALNDIALLADVRSMPGSARLPQFNKAALQSAVLGAGIGYRHLPELGGRVRPVFNDFQSYMGSDKYAQAITRLEAEACKLKVACMCAEADWQRCHRSLISDFLQDKGWQVIHIGSNGAASPHIAKVIRKPGQGTLF